MFAQLTKVSLSVGPFVPKGKRKSVDGCRIQWQLKFAWGISLSSASLVKHTSAYWKVPDFYPEWVSSETSGLSEIMILFWLVTAWITALTFLICNDNEPHLKEMCNWQFHHEQQGAVLFISFFYWLTEWVTDWSKWRGFRHVLQQSKVMWWSTEAGPEPALSQYLPRWVPSHWQENKLKWSGKYLRQGYRVSRRGLSSNVKPPAAATEYVWHLFSMFSRSVFIKSIRAKTTALSG